MKSINIISISLSLLMMACSADKNSKALHVVTSAEYPPFEYIEEGQLRGFDIDLAKLIAKKLRMEVVFDNVQFNAVFASLGSGKADMAISTITITPLREKNFDFSQPYYFESIAAVYPISHPIKDPIQLVNKKIACQLGTTMEIWLKKNKFDFQLLLLNNSTQSIEALKAGHVDVVIMDGSQGSVFSHKTPGLSYSTIAKSSDGYGIAFTKHSPLTIKVNKILHQLNTSGELNQLKIKWLGLNHA